MAIDYSTNLSGRVDVQNENTTTLLDYPTVTAGGSPVDFTISDNYLINKAPENPNISSPSLWKKVILACSPQNSDQFKSLTFRRISGTLKCSESWSAYAYQGTWYVDKVYIVNLNGVIVKIDGSSFSTDTINIS